MTESGSGKNLFVDQLREGQRVEDVFFVARADKAETKAGKPYLILNLMDKTGEIGGRVWENAERLAEEAQPGAPVRVFAQAQSFRDELQLRVDSLQRLSPDDPAVDLGDFLPTSKRPLEEMVAELDERIRAVNDQGLRKLLRKVLRGRVKEDFCRAPAAKKMHHAYLGGLLEHSLSVTGLADLLAEHYPQLDRDLLVTGALLHDLGKIREFGYEMIPFDYTDAGRLVGHMMLGCEMVKRAGESIGVLAPERLDQVLHLILSHHGRPEYGAPVAPQTVEAILLHHLDDMDSKVNYIDRLCDKMETPGYGWSDYQRPLERFLLLRKPDPEELRQRATEVEQQRAGRGGKGVKKNKAPGGGSPQRSLF